MGEANAALRVLVVTPAPAGNRGGNRATALRWAAHLRALGCRVRVRERWHGEAVDLLVAIHAVKSADSVIAAAQAIPGLRIAVLLAGTDIEPVFAPTPAAAAAVARADVLVALHGQVQDLVPLSLRPKLRAIEQSATAPASHRRLPFRACVLAHLRPVKDPLLPIQALRLLPTAPIELVLAGRALTPDLAAAENSAPAGSANCPASRRGNCSPTATPAWCHPSPRAAPTSSPKRSPPARHCW
jgi:hypothetical protein